MLIANVIYSENVHLMLWQVQACNWRMVVVAPRCCCWRWKYGNGAERQKRSRERRSQKIKQSRHCQLLLCDAAPKYVLCGQHWTKMCIFRKSKLSIAIPSNKTKRLKQSKGQRMSYIALKKPRVIGALAVLHLDISWWCTLPMTRLCHAMLPLTGLCFAWSGQLLYAGALTETMTLARPRDMCVFYSLLCPVTTIADCISMLFY